MSSSPRRRRCEDRKSRDERGSSIFTSRVSLLLERRQLRAIIGNENREQACGFRRAGVLADEMLAAGRLEERLTGLVDLGRSGRRVLRADLACQHIGHHAAGVMMADRLATGCVVHQYGGQALAGDVGKLFRTHGRHLVTFGMRGRRAARDQREQSHCRSAVNRSGHGVLPFYATAALAFTGCTARKAIASRFQALIAPISMVRLTVSASEKWARTSS